MLMDIVADAIRDSSLPNLSTRKSNADEGRLIAIATVKFEASGVVFLRHSVPMFDQTDIENLFLKRSGVI